jgi:hypothetical protein
MVLARGKAEWTAQDLEPFAQRMCRARLKDKEDKTERWRAKKK